MTDSPSLGRGNVESSLRGARAHRRYPSNLERDFNSTVLKRMPYVTDLTCGNPGGAAPIANTRSGGTRVDACESCADPAARRALMPDRGYLWNKSKPNLTSACH